MDTACVKVLGSLKKKKQEKEDDENGFHRFQVHHFSNVLEQFLCYCKDVESRFKYILMGTIHYQVKYWRLNVNTLHFSRHLVFHPSLLGDALPKF